MTTSTLAETASCPNHLALLRSAFEVAIDLRTPTEDNVSCSQQDTQILQDLVEDSMDEATRKIAEWEPSDQFKDGDSKVCNGSQQQSRRRLDQSYGAFHYTGGMRCRLCSPDDSDGSSGRGQRANQGSKIQTLKFDKTSQSMKCHRYFSVDDEDSTEKESVLDPRKAKSHYTIDVRAPSMAQELRIDVSLDLENGPSWNGQHIYIIINNQTFDLGPFQMGSLVEKQSPGFNMTNEVGWSIKPGRIYSPLYSSIFFFKMNIPRSFYSKTSMLKVEFLFGEKTASPRHVGRPWPFITYFGTILPPSECEAVTNPLVPSRSWNRKLKQQTIDSVSSPTSPVFSPVSSPHSSPVAAPVNNKEVKRATAKKKNRRRKRINQAKSLISKIMLPKRQISLRKKTSRKISNVNSPKQRTGTKKKKKKKDLVNPDSVPAQSGPAKRASRNNPKRNSSSSTRQKTRNRSISKTMKPKRNSSMMTKKKSSEQNTKQRMMMKKSKEKKTKQRMMMKKKQPMDKGITSAAIPSYPSRGGSRAFSTSGEEESVSEDSRFQSQVKSTLATVLQDKIQNTLRPGHCMYAYAKSITAEVDLVPKPDWEEQLPVCDGQQS